MCFDDVTLHRLWEVELEILDVIHDVCVKYNLRYTLAFGTLIGAVRHNGLSLGMTILTLLCQEKIMTSLFRYGTLMFLAGTFSNSKRIRLILSKIL